MIALNAADPSAEERLSTSWTGSCASFVSQHGDHGTVPYSELAMHTRIAGLAVQRYALFTDSTNPERGIIWAQVFTDQGMTDGLPSEVLPWPVRHKHTID